MTLQLDYRPECLADMEGNGEAIAQVKAILKRDDIPHAFLITGPSGTGKTTLARIIAKELGCKGLDYQEINSSDFNGVETVRDIIRNMRLSPAQSPCRAWTIDEAHKLTDPAQDAFLKPLEDTPAHVYFIVCTTDPQKLKPAFKRRCCHLQLDAISDSQLLDFLTDIASEENKEVPDKVLERIMEDSTGSCGIALAILDAIIDLPVKDMLAAAEKRALEQNEAIELCRALIGGKGWNEVSKILQGLTEANCESVRRAVYNYAAAVLRKADKPQAWSVMEAFREPYYNNTPAASLVQSAYEAIKSN